MAEKITSTEDLIKELLTKLTVAPVLPVQYDAWDTDHIARYMKRSPDTVRREIVVQPTFPRPMRLPGSGRSQALYKAREVIAWLESQTS
jgi:predicted DNA-binding transcriptional regulator AlpA